MGLISISKWNPYAACHKICKWYNHAVNSLTNIFVIAINTLRPRQNGRHFPDDIFRRIFLNENVRISINITLKFVPKGPINNILALVQIMTWRRPGDKPLSEPMVLNLLTHICVTWPQWVKPFPSDTLRYKITWTSLCLIFFFLMSHIFTHS